MVDLSSSTTPIGSGLHARLVPGLAPQTTSLLSAVAIVILGSLVGCSFNKLAAQVAHGQQAGAEVLRRESTVAFTLCREEAAFTYLEGTLTKIEGKPVPPPVPFTEWYAHDPAKRDTHGGPIPWSSYCSDLDRTGEVFHSAVLALGDYAGGIEALTDAKDFDGTSLNTIGTSVSSISDSLHAAAPLVSTAKDIGSATSSMAGKIVSLIRTHELKKVLVDSHDSVTSLLGHLDKYLDALDGERRAVSGSRSDVVGLIATNRVSGGGFTPASEGALEFDLSTDAMARLARIGEHIASDKTLVSLILAAENTLETAAKGGSDDPAHKAAADLSNLIAALGRQRPEDL